MKAIPGSACLARALDEFRRETLCVLNHNERTHRYGARSDVTALSV